MEIFKLFGSIFVDTTEADEKISKTENNGKGLGEMFSNVAKTATKWGTVLATAAITAASAIGGIAVNTAVDIDKAMDSYIVSTGVAKESTQEYEEVLKNIYKNNYGEDFQDIADSMAEVKRQIGEINNVDLQNITEDALALRDTYGVEVKESVRSAKMMMDRWGLSAKEAYNLIAQGAQQGLDKNGDLLDSINEYSVHFKQNGIGATEMFNIFKAGAESGAFSIDKVGDAIKEMGIRMKDGSTTDTLKSMKLDADELSQAFGEGGEKASWAFNEVINGLKNIEDPIKQNKVGVAIFGTMWEDLGKDAVLAMTNASTAFDGTMNTINQIKEVKYDNLTSLFEGLKRNVEILLLPLGNSLIPILQQVIQLIMDNMPIIQGILSQFAPVVTSLFSLLLPPILNLAQTILPIIFNLLQTLIPVLSQILGTILPVIVQLLNMLLPPILQIVQMILPVLIQLIQPILSLLQPFISLLQPIIDAIMILIQPLIELINMILPPIIQIITEITQAVMPNLRTAIEVVAAVISTVLNAALQTIMPIVQNVMNIFTGLIDFIKNVFTGNWQGAWENIKNIFKNIAEGLGNIFKAPINFIIGLINGFIAGLNKLKIPDWVPGVGGFSINIPQIPKLKVGMNYVPEDDFPALLHKGEAVLTKEENAIYRKNLQNPNRDDNQMKELLQLLKYYLPLLLKAAGHDILIDKESLIATLLPDLDDALGTI